MLRLVGFVPTTEIMRSASSAQKFYCRYILHGMLRFTKATRTVQQAANAIVSLALDEKFKGLSWWLHIKKCNVRSDNQSSNKDACYGKTVYVVFNTEALYMN